MKLLVTLSAFLILARCNPGHEKHTAGGPCSYDTVRIKATVIAIDPVKSDRPDTLCNVKLKLGGHVYKDTMLLNHMIRSEINSGFVKKHDIKVGKVFSALGYFITSGTCNPEMYTFDEPGFEY